MTERMSRPIGLAALLSTMPLVVAGCVTTSKTLPDTFAVGRNAQADRCSAIRTFPDPKLRGEQDVAYALNCGGSGASRAVGLATVMPVATRPAEADGSCGAEAEVALTGVGPVRVRRCVDATIGGPAIVVRFERRGRSYRGAVQGAALAPMERVLTALVASETPSAAGNAAIAQIAPSSIPAGPTGSVATMATENAGDFDATGALRQGIDYNRQGFYVDASRVLNDAISRLSASAVASTRVELQLEAGLADSNIRFSEAAAAHFKAAGDLLAANPSVDATGLLERKRSTYRALDALNRRDWRSAVVLLQDVDGAQRSGFPLEDQTTLGQLNRPVGSDAASAVVGSDALQRSLDVVRAQRAWALSIASLAAGGADAEQAGAKALADASQRIALLLEDRYDARALVWLAAQIERQGGRLEARRAGRLTGDARQAAYSGAVTRFDCAIDVLSGRRPAREATCTIQLDPAARARLVQATLTSSPIVAETQIERASLRARTRAAPRAVLDDYGQAVDSLIASGRAGSLAPAGLEDYLDLLSATATTDRGYPAAERFFLALQSVGEPAIARQMSQLQATVAAGGAATAKLRERSDLQREVSGLGYQIADAASDPEFRARLEAQKRVGEARIVVLQDELIADGRQRAVDDKPATLAEVQAALASDEVYFKLVDIRSRTFGIVIGKTSATIYTVDVKPSQLLKLSELVRQSIRDETTQIPVFKVSAAAALFSVLAGPARDQLIAAKRIVVDPGGPLNTLPAGVLVTDLASAKTYDAAVKRAPTSREVANDYSRVAFLARHADLSIALSPRSFIGSRGSMPSAASHPFIGFGQHTVAASSPDDAAAVRVGIGCPLQRAQLVAFSANNAPIPEQTIINAETAFGVPDAPRVIGAAFTDTLVEARTDLDQYQVLHFATHGLPETRVGCTSIPPALLTTLGGAGSDGFLSFDEIARLHLDANLVVLAACQTASSASREAARRSGQEDSGRSLDGLVRAFLAANARAVMATYWQVSNGAESDNLFRAFYTYGRTEPIGDALREAQTELIAQPQYSHPYYWGAYFLVGDASKGMLTGRATVAGR